MAVAMKKTLVECEVPTMEGDSKFCATSLKSMLKFSMMSLRTRDVQASSITVNEHNSDAEMKSSYSIAPTDVHVIGREKLVPCHAQPYLYVVFYCYMRRKSKAYMVALEENDGMKVEDSFVPS